MCLYPRLIPNKRFTATKKNGGNIPAVLDNRTLYVPKKCGKCMECRKQISRDWKARLTEEIKETQEMTFVTLTFSTEALIELNQVVQADTKNELFILKHFTADIKSKEKQERRIKNKQEGYGLDNEICTLAVRRFTERWRRDTGKTIKHWLITELGNKQYEHVHLHGLIYSKDIERIRKKWQYGFIYGGKYVNERTINYIVKYVYKTDAKHKYYTPIILNSKGIGASYIKRNIDIQNNKYNGEKTNETYKTRSGHKIGLPTYYRNKIYTDEQKEQLWINKLNKNERYVDGQKIDISNGEEEYYNALKAAQAKSKALGYENDETNWKRKYYEEERRKAIHQKRLTKE
jgi:hypothetical protein